ncbi:SEC59/DGK1/VTE5 family protein [Candidatus Bandiella numerosa]|uniref:diacylglycerol/polyprenol kinase family protein n=1 Tax=Candidatus Bandiella numerosa TaxID=2570586 RepID=UPI00249E318D|nr:diacylglycerol/polyprenol kinase family protein [Candidatus Bandiella numerosa]WHA04902.1 SEC59/DGK1/VTE5 family protein [Candidatus Bandiella numerosa]
MKHKNSSSLSIEIYRKSIHLIGLIFPVIYHYYDKETITIISLFLLAISFIIDKLRIKFDLLEHKFFKKIGLAQIYRDHEKENYSALTFALIGMSICLFISSKHVFNLAISILILSDTMAALIGILYGRTKINGKSFEGSMAFFATSCILSLVIARIYNLDINFLIAAFFASLIATIVELYSKNSKINDNMTIPITVCIVMNFIGNY